MKNPPRMRYTADLCGTISQSLKALQGYGIMALELIQNADDAGASHLTLDVRDDALVVRNSAVFTNCGQYGEVCDWVKSGGPSGNHKACNLHAISTMGARSKFESADQIGRFGIGFVSVFQVTDTPIIRSGNCELVLNPIEPQIEPRIVPNRENTEFELPWATAETPVRTAIDSAPVPREIAELVTAEILETIGSSVLFLRHLLSVEVLRNGNLVERLTIDRDADSIVLHFGISDEKKRWLLLKTSAKSIIEEWNLFQDYPQLQNHKRSAEVTLAIPADDVLVEGKLFAYLPTQQSSRLPLHVNGDFYPESSRKDIVLRGKGQERHWNEALIKAAADLIEDAFNELKLHLGPVGLWRLGESCFTQRDDEIFGCYWNAFQNAARQENSVFSATGSWLQPDKAFIDGEVTESDEFVLFTELGLPLVAESVLPFRKSLEAVGVRRLTTEMVVSVIEKRAPARDVSLRPYLAQIWQLVDQIVQAKNSPQYAKNFTRLQSACFLLDTDGEAVAPSRVWRMPSKIKADHILAFLPNCPIVSNEVVEFEGIAELLDVYDLESFAGDLARTITTDEEAKELIGPTGESSRNLYELMLRFPPPSDSSTIAETLKSVPFLRTRTGYVTPERAQLPGGFEDPTGYLEFLDVSQFPSEMDNFARQTLGVRVLSFPEYLEEHLPNIVEEHGLEPESFRAIAVQVVQHRHELAAEGVFNRLSELCFVPTRADTLAKPRDCYQWSAQIEQVLGIDFENWLDEEWLPEGRARAQFQDILATELEMPSRPTLSHMLQRIENIANAGIVSDETVASLNRVVDRIRTQLPGTSEEDRRRIASLQDIAFIPALWRGERDQSQFYRPIEVYQATRATGFDSQVLVVDLPVLRRAGREATDLMNLIKMPQVPPVAQVVSHLRHCVESGAKASSITYDLLNEAVVGERDLEDVLSLADEPYLFDPVTEGYLKATEVFWSAPRMGRYWKNASQDMHRQAKLHEFLGVRSGPGPEDFARLMVQICSDPESDPNYHALHAHCVVAVCRALEAEEDAASAAIDIIAENVSLIARDGRGVFPSDVLWVDRPYLVEPFGTDLDGMLVDPPQIDRSSLSRFFKRIGVEPISNLAVQRLAEQPNRLLDPIATALLRDRSDLLLWLAPNEEARSAMRSALEGLSVAMTGELKVQVELNVGITPVISPPATAQAYLEPDTLHVRGSAMSQGAWTGAFRQIFLSIEHHCPHTDIKPLATTAVLVIRSESRDEAEAALIATDFAPPPALHGWGDAKAAALPDLDSDAETSELDREYEDENHDDVQIDDLIDENPGSSSGKQTLSEENAEHHSESGALKGRDSTTPEEHANQRPNKATSNSETGLPSSDRKIDTVPSGGLSIDRTSPNRAGKIIPLADDYKSKVGGGSFGSENDGQGATPRGSSTEGAGAGETGGRQSKPKSSRMLAYVSRAGDRSDSDRRDLSADLDKEIDARAIERAMRYETDQGRSPDEQDHFNPGFDIISTEPNGRRRLIEVKGLRGPWNERGTKLSRTQFSMAQTNADEYWLYIVEAALDPNAQQLYAIRNPFQQVDEYWFDSAWKSVAERLANTAQLNARVGAAVHHEQWGRGRILEIKKKGLQTGATVDFGFQGKKFITVNNSLKFVD